MSVEIDAALYEFADGRSLIEGAANERLDAILETAKRRIGYAADPMQRALAAFASRAALDMLNPNALYNVLTARPALATTLSGDAYGYGFGGSMIGSTFGCFGRWV